MGDVIHTLPAVAALRTMFPEAEIGWAIEERWAELLSSHIQPGRSLPFSPQRPLVNTIHLVNTMVWRKAPFCKANREATLNAVRELRQAKYDMAIDFQGAWKSAGVAILSRATMRLGFRQPRERGASIFYHRTAIAQGAHIIEQNLSLLSALGHRPEVPQHTPLPCDQACEQ
jgi:heptosyltransferase-1